MALVLIYHFIPPKSTTTAQEQKNLVVIYDANPSLVSKLKRTRWQTHLGNLSIDILSKRLHEEAHMVMDVFTTPLTARGLPQCLVAQRGAFEGLAAWFILEYCCTALVMGDEPPFDIASDILAFRTT